MKRLVLFFMLLLTTALIFAVDFDASQIAVVDVVVPNPSTDTLLAGTPFDPESIYVTIYDDTSSNVRRARTAMTKFNSITGYYRYKFDLPDDSSNFYVAVIDIGYAGWDSLFYITKVVNAVNNFDAAGDTTLGEKILINKIDTLNLISGSNFANRYFAAAADSDNEFFCYPNGDTGMVKTWYHIGGSPNGAPDSIAQRKRSDWGI